MPSIRQIGAGVLASALAIAGIYYGIKRLNRSEPLKMQYQNTIGLNYGTHKEHPYVRFNTTDDGFTMTITRKDGPRTGTKEIFTGPTDNSFRFREYIETTASGTRTTYTDSNLDGKLDSVEIKKQNSHIVISANPDSKAGKSIMAVKQMEYQDGKRDFDSIVEALMYNIALK